MAWRSYCRRWPYSLLSWSSFAVLSSSVVLSSLGRIIAVGVICAVVGACEVGYIGSV